MNIRTIAIGLIMGSYFMVTGTKVVTYMSSQLQSSPLVAWHLALSTVSQASANALGGNLVIPFSWALLCLGAGLFIASIVWPVVERSVIYWRNKVAELVTGPSNNYIASIERASGHASQPPTPNI